MQMKSSFRVLKWSLLAAVVASLASACVVTSGDGDIDDDFGEGGDGGTKTNTGGTKAGSSSSGSSNGGTSNNAGETGTDGGTTSMTMGGSDTGPTFVPGVCQENEPIDSHGMLALCDEAAGDDDCTKCLKDKVCPEFMACFGDDPATACSVGQTEGAPGQFECIIKCFKDNKAGEVDADMLLAGCGVECDECGTGGPNDETTDLVTKANDAATCQAECFPF